MSVIEKARKIVEEYERGKAKDQARGYHRIDGAMLTDEVILSQEVIRLARSETRTTERAQSEPKPPAEDRGSCGVELRGRPSQERASTQAAHSQTGGGVEAPAMSNDKPQRLKPPYRLVSTGLMGKAVVNADNLCVTPEEIVEALNALPSHGGQVEAAAKVCEALAADSMAKARRMGPVMREEALEVARVEEAMGLACAGEIRKLAPSSSGARSFPVCKDHTNSDWNQPTLEDDNCVLCRLFYLEAQEGLLEEWQQRAKRAEDAIAEIKRPLDEQMARLNATVTRLNGENERLRSLAESASGERKP